jgi:hypothetical protein
MDFGPRSRSENLAAKKRSHTGARWKRTKRQILRRANSGDLERSSPATPAACIRLEVGAVSVKASTITCVVIRPTIALPLFALVLLAAFSGTANARSCGMMKPPAYMGMPAGPMHYTVRSKSVNTKDPGFHEILM